VRGVVQAVTVVADWFRQLEG